MPNRRQKMLRTIPLAILLTVAVCMLAVVGVRAVRSYQEVRNERRLAAGEAVGVRPWMTIPYIARVYGIPEAQLFAALNIADTEAHRRAPLEAIARREGRDLDADIAALNALIDARRIPTGAPPRATP